MSEIDFLKSVSQLSELDDVELTVIEEALTVLDYAPGSLILEEGTPNRAIHIVRKGRVRVTRQVDDKEVALCDLAEGQTFGELSILGDGTTTATLRAIPETRIFSLSADDLKFVLEQSPGAAAKFWQAIARDLGDRLVSTNEVVRSYFEVNRALVENPTFREAYAMCNR
ncbi:MAG: cyclic nucleotide-binding domain-containing protein [Thermoanaerobaculia bacterium]|nr:cyclic nucleotide-binding domain-containing protein [Thermoanaerobaculia bacterium]